MSTNSDDYYSRSRAKKSQRLSLTFTVHAVEQLIESVKERPVLWDPSNPQYSLRTVRREEWATIASGVFHNKFNVNELQTKWDNLRIQFRHNYLKSLKKRSGKPPYWRFYPNLLFLMGSTKKDKSRTQRPIVKTEDESAPNLPTFEDSEPNLTAAQTPEISDDQPSSHSNQDFFDPLLEPSTPHFADTRNYDDLERKDDFYIADIQDSFQMFGNYIASELRQIRNVREAKRVQRKLTYKLLECLDEIDDDTGPNFE